MDLSSVGWSKEVDQRKMQPRFGKFVINNLVQTKWVNLKSCGCLEWKHLLSDCFKEVVHVTRLSTGFGSNNTFWNSLTMSFQYKHEFIASPIIISAIVRSIKTPTLKSPTSTLSSKTSSKTLQCLMITSSYWLMFLLRKIGESNLRSFFHFCPAFGL